MSDQVAGHKVPEVIVGVTREESERVLRCKVRVVEVLHVKNPDGTTQQERVTLSAVYGPVGSLNADWAKFTPAATFTISIDNPRAHGKLSSGHEFYVDFIPA